MIELDADPSYWLLSDADRKACCNGCGAKGGINVPDTIWGLSMTDVCNIHDYDYKHGTSQRDKRLADDRMLFNMLSKIEAQTGWQQWILKPLRRRRALFYYECVVSFGDKAFWAGKEKPSANA